MIKFSSLSWSFLIGLAFSLPASAGISTGVPGGSYCDGTAPACDSDTFDREVHFRVYIGIHHAVCVATISKDGSITVTVAGYPSPDDQAACEDAAAGGNFGSPSITYDTCKESNDAKTKLCDDYANGGWYLQNGVCSFFRNSLTPFMGRPCANSAKDHFNLLDTLETQASGME